MAPRGWSRLFGVVALVATAIVYRRVPAISFFWDDFVNLLQIAEVGLGRFVVSPFAGHMCLGRNLVFYACRLAFGLNPGPYYALALLTHLVNVALLFRAVRLLTGDAALAALGAAMWGTSPLCVGAVGWYSVYGHVLVATILLIVLGQVAQHARSETGPSGRTAMAWALMLLVGATCFGVGIGLAIVFPVAVVCLAPKTLRDRRAVAVFATLPVAVVILYFAYRRVAALVDPLPASEVLVVTIGVARIAPILRFVGDLIGFGTSSVLSGFIFDLGAHPTAVLPIAAATAFFVLAALLVARDVSLCREIIGLLALTLGVYAMIAVGRANILAAAQQSLSEAAAAARYHYVGPIPLVVAVCLLLGRLFGRPAPVRLPSIALFVAWLTASAYGFARSSFTVDEHEGARVWIAKTLGAIDEQIDAAPAGADVYLVNQPPSSVALGPIPPREYFPGWAAVFVLAHDRDVVRGRRVRFVERDRDLLAAVRAGRHPRLAELLVAPNAVPALTTPSGRGG